MERLVSFVAAAVFLVGCHPPVEIVDVAQLVAHPARYSGRTVFVDGCWKSGFECSELVITESRLGGLVWVEPDWRSISSNAPAAVEWYKNAYRTASTNSLLGRKIIIHFKGSCTFESAMPGLFDRVLLFGEHRLGMSKLRQFRHEQEGFGHLSGSPLQLTIRTLDFYELQER